MDAKPYGLLQDKVILVVGASTGIGADAARLFAREGASVMLAARSEDLLHDLLDELHGAGLDAAAVRCDVTVPADVAHMVDAVVDRYGRIDGALNNAAITQAGLLEDLSEEEFDRIMAVNVKGVWLCMRAELAAMRKAGRGSIVNVTSVGALRASSGMGAYQATKHAVAGLTGTAAHDAGPAGIRVNSVAPGPTATPMLAATRVAIPGGVEARVAATPLRKMASTDDVAETAAWLMSDRAAHISGVQLRVDGGYAA
ncbi:MULTISPECIES: SDR family NAD(P)-dependent oxidoreductase [Microbacterium]|uniref:SDR family NAD(P)-dependent oxidoreductase n=1 Tax=Microbacterium TaxID=33882 RepID=UPI001650173B|nr:MULTISPECIES: SDR family NAD(P)-dependent oxidoreductase [Microbacterium]